MHQSPSGRLQKSKSYSTPKSGALGFSLGAEVSSLKKPTSVCEGSPQPDGSSRGMSRSRPLTLHRMNDVLMNSEKFFYANDAKGKCDDRPKMAPRTNTAPPETISRGDRSTSPVRLSRPRAPVRSNIFFTDGREQNHLPPASPTRQCHETRRMSMARDSSVHSLHSSHSGRRISSAFDDTEPWPAAQTSPLHSESRSPGLLGRVDPSLSPSHARSNRKVLDLEISNTSLRAFNKNLEHRNRRQVSEIRSLKRKVVRASDSALLPAYSPQDSPSSSSSSSDSDQGVGILLSDQVDSLQNASAMLTNSMKKATKITNALLYDAKRALEMVISEGDIGGRVLRSPDLTDSGDDITYWSDASQQYQP